MALSGTKTQKIRDGYMLSLEWEASQSIPNNTSKITCKLYLKNDYALYISKRNPKIIIDGTTINLESPAISSTGNHLLGTASRTLNHKNDGTRSFTLSASFNLNATISGQYYGTVNIANSTNTLDQIYRATQPKVNVTSADIGSSITISTPRASDSFMHKLYYSFGTKNKILISDSVTTSCSFTIPPDLANEIPHKMSGTLTITCDTYYGSDYIGTKTCSLTIEVPSSYAPSISGYTITEMATLPSEFSGKFIQNISDLQVTVNASGSHGSWITDIETTVSDMKFTGASFKTGVLKKSGRIQIKTSITDSRGAFASYFQYIDVVAYSLPTITKFQAQRCDVEGNVDENEGVYLKYVYSYNVTSLSNTNIMNLAIQYYNNATSSWNNIITNVEPIYSATDVTGFSVAVWFNPDETIKLRLEIQDAIKTVYAYDVLESTNTLINFAENGKALAFNGVCNIDEGVQFHNGLYDKYGKEIKFDNPHVLWSGGYLMNNSQSITLSETVSSQKTGIILVFSPYVDSKAVDGYYTTHFVSKLAVAQHPGRHFSFLLCDEEFTKIACKTIWIADDKLTGVDGNQNYGTTNGVTWKNSLWVLREIYGV